MTEIVDVTITAPDARWLEDHCAMLVERRLAACANVIPSVQSVYRWDGAIHRETEALATLRTRQACVAQIVELTKKFHPYEVPHVLAIPVVEANEDYADWVRAATDAEQD